MTETEWNQWMLNAAIMLRMTGTYSEKEISYIVDWFYSIKTRKEIDLLGDDEYASNLFHVVNSLNTDNLKCGEMVAHSMYARLFMYAPYIQKQYQKENWGQ